MSTTTSQLPDVLDAIQTGLDARAGLDGVTVLSGPADVKDLGLEYVSIGIGEVDVPQSQRAVGNSFKQEAARIECELRANAVYNTSIEATIRAARDRAFAMLAEVEDFLRTTPNLSITAVDALVLRDVTYVPGWDDKVRVAVIRFTIAGNISLISS